MVCTQFQVTYFSTGIAVRVVDKESELFVVVVLDERVEVVVAGYHAVRAQYVISVRDQPSLGCWGVGMDFLPGEEGDGCGREEVEKGDLWPLQVLLCTTIDAQLLLGIYSVVNSAVLTKFGHIPIQTWSCPSILIGAYHNLFITHSPVRAKCSLTPPQTSKT